MMRAAAIVVGMLTTTPSRADEPCDAWLHWPASDIRGSDLQQARAATLDACKMACLRVADCRAFTWPGCQLKSAKERAPNDAYAVFERPSNDRCAPTGHAASVPPTGRVTVQTKSGHSYSCRHPELFDPALRPEWFAAEFLSAVGDPSALGRIVTREHRNAQVYSFPFLTPRFARLLLEEAEHYAASGLPNPKPNGMNNYGILWNHIGMEATFDAIRSRYIAPVAAHVFPHLGGATIDRQHTYLVHYSTDEDAHGLDIHHDSCDITFNAALQEPNEYEGSGLRFCGLYSTPEYRRYTFTYRHVLGRAILYDGRMRHGAEPITSGSRTNLVMWAHSSRHRNTVEYEAGNRAAHLQDGRADPRCVSHHHDTDFCDYRLEGHAAKCGGDGTNVFMRRWRQSMHDNRYWQVGNSVREDGSFAQGQSRTDL